MRTVTPAVIDMLGDLAEVFEASELKHRLRRAGFSTPRGHFGQPFLPQALPGGILLTAPLDESRIDGEPLGRARCIFASGVMRGSAVPGDAHPELHVALLMTASIDEWQAEDESRIRPLLERLGPHWQATRQQVLGRSVWWLASGRGLAGMLEECEGDLPRLARGRDAFFKAMWTDLARLEEDDYAWMMR